MLRVYVELGKSRSTTSYVLLSMNMMSTSNFKCKRRRLQDNFDLICLSSQFILEYILDDIPYRMEFIREKSLEIEIKDWPNSVMLSSL